MFYLPRVQSLYTKQKFELFKNGSDELRTAADGDQQRTPRLRDHCCCGSLSEHGVSICEVGKI